MIGNFKWLLTNEEIEFEKQKFKGKLAGKAYKYSLNIDGLIRTRILIFAMSILVLYRVLANYLFYEIFDIQFLIERIIFGVIILIGGLIFNKFRILSIIIAVVPLIIITGTYLLIPGQFHLRTVAFMVAMIFLILSGTYNHIQAKNIKNQLEKNYY